MDLRQEFESYRTLLETEHRQFERELHAIEEEFSQEPNPGIEPIRRELALGLKKFTQELAAHFRREDDEGCVEEAVSFAPSLAPQADRLRSEHPVLLHELEDLLQRLEATSADAREWSSLRRDFQTFCGRLRRHARAEEELLRRGFNVVTEA